MVKTIKEKIAEKKAMQALYNSRNVGIKFPYKCNRCGELTVKITEGNWKGCYHCETCDIYQEYI